MVEPVQSFERRRRQRFVAKRRGEFCFWVLLDGQRLPLHDLSLEGFSMPHGETRPVGYKFRFVLQRAGVPDEIHGRATCVNHFGDPADLQAGCTFDLLEGDGLARLEDWLTAHVLANATVPITEKDATKIVSGPSLV